MVVVVIQSNCCITSVCHTTRCTSLGQAGPLSEGLFPANETMKYGAELDAAVCACTCNIARPPFPDSS